MVKHRQPPLAIVSHWQLLLAIVSHGQLAPNTLLFSLKLIKLKIFPPPKMNHTQTQKRKSCGVGTKVSQEKGNKKKHFSPARSFGSVRASSGSKRTKSTKVSFSLRFSSFQSRFLATTNQKKKTHLNKITQSLTKSIVSFIKFSKTQNSKHHSFQSFIAEYLDFPSKDKNR